jgi:hypothetical protein
VQRRHYPWILIAIELIAFASGILTGVLVTVILIAIYLLSLRVHPRMRHGRCNGTGEHRGALFTWTHRKCPDCYSGRIIRWGAGRWGSGHIKREYKIGQEARRAARTAHRWR